jgi:hypothetical protein
VQNKVIGKFISESLISWRQIAEARFQPPEFWKRGLACCRHSKKPWDFPEY